MQSRRILALWLTLTFCGWPSSPSPQTQASQPEGPSWHEQKTLLKLLSIRRVHVDRFGGGETAAQIRDMIISSLQATKLFVITENEERAGAFLRGSAEDLVFTDTFSSSESLNARASLSTGRDPDRSSSNRRSRYGSVSVGDNESTRAAERKHEATASVRVVSEDGDVLWSTTQESQGGKFRGAATDVAEKVARQLLRDYERARKLRHLQEK
jgi:hypothetical protein